MSKSQPVTRPSPDKSCSHQLGRARTATRRKKGSSEARRWWLLGGAVASTIVASACCLGPLLLALLGLGGGGLLLKSTPLRPYFVGVTVVLLAMGFYLAYRKPRSGAVVTTDDACACETPRAKKVGRAALWVVTLVVTALLASPYVIPLFVG